MIYKCLERVAVDVCVKIFLCERFLEDCCTDDLELCAIGIGLDCGLGVFDAICWGLVR